MTKIVTIAPLVRGPWADSLTYFSSQKLEVGDLVNAPVGRRQIPAVIIDCSPVELMRAEVRSSEIGFKKIGAPLVSGFIDEAVIMAAKDIAAFQVAPLGAVIKRLIPQAVIAAYETKPSPDERTASAKNHQPIGFSVSVVQENLTERLTIYKNLIREAFAKKQSVLVCAPTNLDLGTLSTHLPKGIENYTVIIDAQKSKVATAKAWELTRTSDHPLLIITTLIGLSVPRDDLGLIILEGDGEAESWEVDRLSLSLRQVVVRLAEARKVKLVIGDDVLSLETIFRTENNEWSPLLPPLKYRSVSSAIQKINKVPDRLPGESEPAILAEETKAVIRTALEANERIAILTSRRGFGSATVCQDCGFTVRCHRCQAPLVLHEGADRTFRCHRCQLVQTIQDRCPNCHGWRQVTLGLGIDRVAKVLSKNFPETPIFILDSDHAPRRSLITKTIKNFLAAPGSIIIGTEMLVHHLRSPIETAIGVALDSQLALPEYRATERLFRQLITLRSLASKNFIIDTRDPDHPLYDYARKGNILDFVRDELDARRQLGFPPLGILVKVSGQGPEAKKIIDWLEIKTASFNPKKVSETGSHATHSLFFKLKSSEWPQPELTVILKSLPPVLTVVINPESLS